MKEHLLGFTRQRVFLPLWDSGGNTYSHWNIRHLFCSQKFCLSHDTSRIGDVLIVEILWLARCMLLIFLVLNAIDLCIKKGF